ARHSSRDMLKKKRSRRMPALLTTMSSRPNASSARWTMRLADSHSATLSVLATACPPAARIWSTTFCAGPASRPSPCTLAPMSFTTTEAPAAANASAQSRPMPPPAPVTIATLPASRPLIAARGAGSGSGSPPEPRVAAVEEPQHRGPLERTPAAPGLRLVEVRGLLHYLGRREVQLRVARHGRHLGLAGALQPEEVGERLADARAHGEQPVVAQDHGLVRAEVAHEPCLLVEVDRHALVLVHADAAEVHGGLRERQQAAVERRHGHAGDRVGVDDAADVGARLVDRAVDDEARLVDAVAGPRVLHHVAVEVDLDQARGRDLVVGHAVGVDEEVTLLAGHARRDVVVD